MRCCTSDVLLPDLLRFNKTGHESRYSSVIWWVLNRVDPQRRQWSPKLGHGLCRSETRQWSSETCINSLTGLTDHPTSNVSDYACNSGMLRPAVNQHKMTDGIRTKQSALSVYQENDLVYVYFNVFLCNPCITKTAGLVGTVRRRKNTQKIL